MDENVKQENWFSRNKKWSLPAFGCLSIIVAAIVAFILLFGAMETKITEMFKDSEPYTIGMETLQNNEEAIEKLGKPIEPNGTFQGNINYEDDNGTADLKIPIKGPKGEATLLIIGEKSGETWTYETMNVTFTDSNEVIDLLPIKKNTD